MRWVLGFTFGSATALGVAACTLTADEYDPARVELEQSSGQSGEEQRPDAAAPAPSATCSRADGCCESDLDCTGSERCVAGVCTLAPETCSGEDVSDCEIPLCPGPDCPMAVASCTDGERNGDESGVDCGRNCPARCGSDVECSENLDCASFNCVGGRCAAATCSDGVRNRDEADVDCGGSCDVRCGAGSACDGDGDCAEGLFCPAVTGTCTNVSCQDGSQNGVEIQTDCGGGECPGCPAGAPCTTAADCASRVCGEDGECAPATCSDETQNQDETGVDCGGSCPDGCGTGVTCSDGEDCESRVCEAGGCPAGIDTCCQEPSCSDGVANGGEPVVDCGSVNACGLCPVGRACTANAQCQTGICAGTCQPPLCSDGRVSGNESDVDCGGSDAACARCGDGGVCRAGNDCASGICQASRCVSCSDGAENGSETDVDCGGNNPACPRCADGDTCDVAGDCAGGECFAGRCATPSCSDSRRNGDETGIDCGGSCPSCSDGNACRLDADCVSNNCSDGLCISCGDNVVNGTETDLDCGGSDPACQRCAPGRVCQVDSDCASGACADGRCCGGTQRDCTRCAERLSSNLNCNTPGGGVDSTGIVNCTAFLACLADNPDRCPTRNTPGCSGDNLSDACPHNTYGGNAGTGLTRANQVLLAAGCQL